MASITEQRETLQHRRDELERTRMSVADRVEAARRDLERSQAELEGLSAQQQSLEADVDATTKLEADVSAALSTINDVRAGGAAELLAARQEHRALTSRVDQELSGERRAALSRGIEQIDDEIATAGRSADEAARRLGEAEAAAGDARRRADAAAAAQEAAIQRLHMVPQAIEAARVRVVTARAAASTAVDAGRMAEAFVRARDLSHALDALDEAVHVTDDQQAAEEVPGLWSEALARSSELTAATAVVQPLRQAAAAAQSDRNTLAAARETHIEAILSEPPAARPDVRPEPGGSGERGPGPQ